MAAKSKFVVPTVEDLEEKETNTADLGAFTRFKLRKEKDKTDTKNVDEIHSINPKQQKTTGEKRQLPISKSELEVNKRQKTGDEIPEETELKSEKKPIQKILPTSNKILINPRQRGNPILKFVRNVPFEFADIVPDYVMGQTTCALFLSLRYHVLKPDYIHERLKQLGRNYKLRVLLVQVDMKDSHHAIKQLTKIAILAECTLMLSWSAEEAGRFLEIYKAYENKPPDALMGKIETDPVSKLTDAISSVKPVNRTNATTLLSTFESFDRIIAATPEELSFCPGMGIHKAKKLHTVLNQPFISKNNESPSKSS